MREMSGWYKPFLPNLVTYLLPLPHFCGKILFNLQIVTSQTGESLFLTWGHI